MDMGQGRTGPRGFFKAEEDPIPYPLAVGAGRRGPPAPEDTLQVVSGAWFGAQKLSEEQPGQAGGEDKSGSTQSMEMRFHSCFCMCPRGGGGGGEPTEKPTLPPPPQPLSVQQTGIRQPKSNAFLPAQSRPWSLFQCMASLI